MQGFIDGYDEKKAGSARMTAEAQQNIVRLLERISLVSFPRRRCSRVKGVREKVRSLAENGPFVPTHRLVYPFFRGVHVLR
jgi:hypothetical protein